MSRGALVASPGGRRCEASCRRDVSRLLKTGKISKSEEARLCFSENELHPQVYRQGLLNIFYAFFFFLTRQFSGGARPRPGPRGATAQARLPSCELGAAFSVASAFLPAAWAPPTPRGGRVVVLDAAPRYPRPSTAAQPGSPLVPAAPRLSGLPPLGPQDELSRSLPKAFSLSHLDLSSIGN